MQSLLLLPLLWAAAQGLTCWDGHVEDANSTSDFTKATCGEGESWCMEIHAKAQASPSRPTEDFKTCWDPEWDNGLYSEFGCLTGQHCLGGACYEEATVCLCKEDNCNDFVADAKATTPIPNVPSTPADKHICYYGSTDDKDTSLEYNQTCNVDENLCVRVTANVTDGKDSEQFEFRSCWSGEYNLEYTRPGCYAGFQHCHITQHGEVCHNDTLICVCADDLCNGAGYTSEAPPVTPGSGLYCYSTEHHDRGLEEGQPDTEACDRDEVFCIESYNDHFAWRGCWSPKYEEGRYNFTIDDKTGVTCETGQHCMFGECHDSTVCLCKDNLCNDFQIKENATTPAPVTMTTTNLTSVCYYGMQHNHTEQVTWQMQACGPEETACVLISDNSTGFKLASCYDLSYNGGRFNSTGEGSAYKCWDDGEHCWDNSCYHGEVCLCHNSEDPREGCNNPEGPTPSPQPTTPGSGIQCWFGSGFGVDGQLTFNLTKQTCNRNETMCVSAYGDDGNSSTSTHYYAGCHDPTMQYGRFNQSDVCIDDIFCPNDHDHEHHGPPGPDCHADNVCTCSASLCNTFNVSSTVSPGTEPPTKPSTMRCWFGEKHSSTGVEDWKVEVCQPNENRCFQMVSDDGFESRECWDLAYEDGRYNGDGCYRGQRCHHEHCFPEATVCICDKEKCNDWTKGGNVTTDKPVTPGSGVLCYRGAAPDQLTSYCASHETMCSYMATDDGKQLGDCYDPHKNNGTYNEEKCYSDVVTQMGDNTVRGKFCVCDGTAGNDLCNGPYFSSGASPSVAAAFALTFTLILISGHF